MYQQRNIFSIYIYIYIYLGKKFKHIIEDEEELKKIFPYGIKHFQVSEKRGSKNIKEILAPSNTCFSNEDQPQNENEHVDEINGSHPCNKPWVYCNILRKTESNQFKSNSNGQTFNIRQNINCQSENVVYLSKSPFYKGLTIKFVLLRIF